MSLMIMDDDRRVNTGNVMIKVIAFCFVLLFVGTVFHFHQLQSHTRRVQSVIFSTSTFSRSPYALHSRWSWSQYIIIIINIIIIIFISFKVTSGKCKAWYFALQHSADRPTHCTPDGKHHLQGQLHRWWKFQRTYFVSRTPEWIKHRKKCEWCAQVTSLYYVIYTD